MTLLALIVVLLIVGVILWGISQLPWIDANVKKVITIVIVVALMIWLLTSLTGHTAGIDTRLW